MSIVIYILLGALVGVVSGFVGIGGGIILVPALVLFFKFSQQTAQGTTLALLLLPIGIFAVWEYYKEGFVDVRVALLLAIGFMIGSFLSARFAVTLPTTMLQRVFGILLLIIGVKFFFFPK
jgi:hypothetical protein